MPRSVVERREERTHGETSQGRGVRIKSNDQAHRQDLASGVLSNDGEEKVPCCRAFVAGNHRDPHLLQEDEALASSFSFPDQRACEPAVPQHTIVKTLFLL